MSRPARYLRQKGQTVVLLLVFMAVGMTVTTAAVAITIINTQGSSAYQLGQDALFVAESGVDNAVIRLLRDPTYTGETVSIGSGTATISVSGTSTVTVVSTGTSSGYTRKVTVTLTASNNTYTVTSWKETP